MRRLCLYIGVSAALLFTFLFFPFTEAQATLFSPGQGIHSNIVGCDSCHQPFKQIYNCTSNNCHPLAATSYKTRASFAFHRLVVSQNCINCHPEHAGRTDQYTNEKFDHQLLSVVQLNQCKLCHDQPKDVLHTSLLTSSRCEACHSTLTWDKARFNHTDLQPARLGNCVTCHALPRDPLHQLVTDKCTSCHRTLAWWPASIDHSALSERGLVSCGLCHKPPQDPQHRGIDLNCARCHSTRTWKQQ